MNNYTKALALELTQSKCLPLFEIHVTDTTGDLDYITCELSFRGDSLVAQRGGVSTQECNSKFIANTRLVVDTCFTLNEHLEAIHEMVLDDIANGDLYAVQY